MTGRRVVWDRDRTLWKPTDPSVTAEGNPPSVHARSYVRAPFPDRAGRWDRAVRHAYFPIHIIGCWIFIPALFAFIMATPSCFFLILEVAAGSRLNMEGKDMAPGFSSLSCTVRPHAHGHGAARGAISRRRGYRPPAPTRTGQGA
jgi:hypothetical protein